MFPNPGLDLLWCCFTRVQDQLVFGPKPTHVDQSDPGRTRTTPRAPVAVSGACAVAGARWHPRSRSGTPRYPNWPGW